MNVPIITAHGALGIWDEVVFIAVVVVMVAMMVITWLRSRSNIPDNETPPADATADAQPPDRFRLD